MNGSNPAAGMIASSAAIWSSAAPAAAHGQHFIVGSPGDLLLALLEAGIGNLSSFLGRMAPLTPEAPGIRHGDSLLGRDGSIRPGLVTAGCLCLARLAGQAVGNPGLRTERGNHPSRRDSRRSRRPYWV